MSLSVTILGCGPSGGVPRVDGAWGACDPGNPRNRRRRCSILVRQEGPKGATRVLVDTPPDLRESVLAANVRAIDGVLFTHDHADHTHGIDDLRFFAVTQRKRIPVYFDAATGKTIQSRFEYCFQGGRAGSGYPAILEPHEIAPPQPVTVEGPGGPVTCTPFWQSHGYTRSLGWRFGRIAYSPDAVALADESVPLLEGLDLWIVDALRYQPHPGHFSVSEALAWIKRLKPKRAVLTHMLHDLDYETLKRELPHHVEPAYDGLRIEIADAGEV